MTVPGLVSRARHEISPVKQVLSPVRQLWFPQGECHYCTSAHLGISGHVAYWCDSQASQQVSTTFSFTSCWACTATSGSLKDSPQALGQVQIKSSEYYILSTWWLQP